MFPTKSDEKIFEEFEQAMAKGSFVIDDPLEDNCEGNEVNNGVKKWKRRIKENKNDGAGGSSESKKIMHRDIEKQRRQEMAGLYSSLRSLLPIEYVKGKRAVCDHIEQAVNYIKDTQNKIEEIKIRRNKLVDPNSNSTHCSDYDCVKVNPLRDDEMEILITTHMQECSFPLSKVLAYLLGLGLNVTTCVSTRGHQHFFHKLHIQVNEITSIDISELKQMLVNLVKVS